jgi:hypothetical protein
VFQLLMKVEEDEEVDEDEVEEDDVSDAFILRFF